MNKIQFEKFYWLEIYLFSTLVLFAQLNLSSCQKNQITPVLVTPDQIQNSSVLTENQLKNDFDYLETSPENRKIAVEMENLESFETEISNDQSKSCPAANHANEHERKMDSIISNSPISKIVGQYPELQPANNDSLSGIGIFTDHKISVPDLNSDINKKAFRRRIYSLISGFIATERNKQSKGSLKVLAFDDVE